MKNKDILRAINDIDWDMVEDARATDGMKSDGVKPTDKRKKIPKAFWTKGALAAACLCLAVITVFTVLPRLNSITPPTPGGDETLEESTPGEHTEGDNTDRNPNRLSGELIGTINKFFEELRTEGETLKPTFEDKLDAIKNGAQPIHVKFDPLQYYFVCAYCDSPCENEKTDFCCSEKYIWRKFDNESEILEYNDNANLVVSLQMNKAQFCIDIVSQKNAVPSIQHCQIFYPQFSDGINVAPCIHFDDTFIFLNDCTNDIVYYYNDKINSSKISCVEMDGRFYATQSISYSIGSINTRPLHSEFGTYYDYLMGVMITDKYDAYTFQYGLFRLEDIAAIYYKK